MLCCARCSTCPLVFPVVSSKQPVMIPPSEATAVCLRPCASLWGTPAYRDVHCSAAPATEVAKAAPELLRTLIYSPPPEWASEQTPPSDVMHPDRRRLGSLAAVLAAAPQAAPGAAISHIFSEGVDVSQRLLVLDGLCAAAHELAGRPLLQPLSATPGAASHHASAGDAPLQDAAPDLLQLYRFVHISCPLRFSIDYSTDVGSCPLSAVLSVQWQLSRGSPRGYQICHETHVLEAFNSLTSQSAAT